MTIILNDVHIGHNRRGGTTPESRERLRDYLLDSFGSTMRLAAEDRRDVLIAGDLFDDFVISQRDWSDAFKILYIFLKSGRNLTLSAGNHDWSPQGNKLSSFQSLCDVLEVFFPENFRCVGINDFERALGNDSLWTLAHCANQDLFNALLEEVTLKLDKGDSLIVHANFDNNFAAQSDHSLNVTRAQAKAVIDRGALLLFAHEHQAKTAMGARVQVLGNQWPTSVSDCLGNDEKFLHLIEGDDLHRKVTWSRSATPGYVEVPWDGLEGAGEAGFVRVIGSATNTQASEVINVLSRFRRESDAFVITNAVKIEGVPEISELSSSFEAHKAFDVLEFIRSQLSDQECAVVESLLKD